MADEGEPSGIPETDNGTNAGTSDSDSSEVLYTPVSSDPGDGSASGSHPASDDGNEADDESILEQSNSPDSSDGSESESNPASDDESRPARDNMSEQYSSAPSRASTSRPASFEFPSSSSESPSSSPSHLESFELPASISGSSSSSPVRPSGFGSIDALIHDDDDSPVNDNDPSVDEDDVSLNEIDILAPGDGPNDPFLPMYAVVVPPPSYDGTFGLLEFGPAAQYCFWPLTFSFGKLLGPCLGVTRTKRIIGFLFFTVLIVMYALVTYVTVVLLLTRPGHTALFLAFYITEPIMYVFILGVNYGFWFFMLYFVLVKDIILYAYPRQAAWFSDKFGAWFERLVISIGRGVFFVMSPSTFWLALVGTWRVFLFCWTAPFHEEASFIFGFLSHLDYLMGETLVALANLVGRGGMRAVYYGFVAKEAVRRVWQAIRDRWSDVRGLAGNDRVVNMEVDMEAFLT